MRKRWLMLLVLLACGALAIVLFAGRSHGPPEPSYQGRPLSSWLTEIRQNSNQGLPYVTAAEAVHKIGTNAVPHLIRWIQEEPPAWKTFLEHAVNAPLEPFGRRWRVEWRETRHAINAMNGFMLLEPDAKAAIPEITRLINAERFSITANSAAVVMPHLGQEAVPPLSVLLTNQSRTTGARNLALMNLHNLGTNALPLVPTVVRCLRDTNIVIGWAATNALLQIAPEALTNAPAQ